MLAASSSQQLVELGERLAAEGIDHRVIVESDPPYAGEVMALGVRPGERSKLKKYFSSLPLLK